MILFNRLWETMEKQNATTYTLEVKAGIGYPTIKRLKENDSVSTNTLDTLCKVLNCQLCDIMEYVPDEKPE